MGRLPFTESQFLDHFMARVAPEPNTGCSLWMGRTDRDGYGKITRAGRTLRAHRVAYELFISPIPKGVHVLHHCDTPPCVNPDHLWLGTNADNIRDRDQKGRAAKQAGEQNGKARLTDKDARAIRSRYAAGETQRPLAREYGVHNTTLRLKPGDS